MAQIQKKFIAANAVDDAKIRLSNNANLRGRNAADSGDVNILKVNTSNLVEMASFFQTPSSPPSSNYDVANKKYVDDSIAAATPTAASVSYDHTSSGLAATTVQAAIDEVYSDLTTFEGTVILKNGSVAYTGNQAMGGFKLTGLGAGTTAGDSVRYEQAILTSGVNAFGADQSMGGFKLTNLADPVSNGDAVSLSYLTARLAGIKPKSAVRVATVAAGTLASSFANGSTIDTIVLATGDRILIKNQASASENGIYTVNASGFPTRATDFDSTSPIDEINGAWVAIQFGSQAGQIWVQFGTVTTVGTDPINFEYFNPLSGLIGGDMITLTGSTFSVDLATTSGLESTNPGNVSGQLRIKLEASNPTLKFTGSNELALKMDPAGALASGAAGVAVQVDGSTIEINTNALRVKDAGITLAKLASNSVDENKIVSTAISTTGGLNGGSGTKLSVRVDTTTVKINGSNNLEGLKELEQKFTLSSGDITNQFVDLAHAAYGADAANNSLGVWVIGAPLQEKAVDYTVSLTGGSGGVTRVTFAGDLATGGNAALIAGDKLVVKYSYLT